MDNLIKKLQELNELIKAIAKADSDFTIPKKITNTLPSVDHNHKTLIHAEHHGFGGEMNNVHPKQKELIHGLDLAHGKPIEEYSNSLNNLVVKHPTNNKSMIVKSAAHAEGGFGANRAEQLDKQKKFGMLSHERLNAARREVLFHNMAHHLGLGSFVPTTSGFHKNGNDYSAQEMVAGLKPRDILNNWSKNGSKPGVHKDAFNRSIKDLHKSGDLHKMAIFDSLMGNEDRHGGNYLFDPDSKKIHLIDHGRALDYKQVEGSTTPHYLEHAEKNQISDKIHPEALNWLNSLDNTKASELLDKYVTSDSMFKNGFLDRLSKLKQTVNNSKNKLSVDLKRAGRIT